MAAPGDSSIPPVGGQRTAGPRGGLAAGRSCGNVVCRVAWALGRAMVDKVLVVDDEIALQETLEYNLAKRAIRCSRLQMAWLR